MSNKLENKMKDIKEVYPGQSESGYFNVCNYNPLLNSLGYEVILKVDDEDYQGDSRVLFKQDNKIGYLQFGWGSCSGCDALQACESYEQIDELRSEVLRGIKWFDNAEQALKFFTNHDWEGDCCQDQDKQKEFIDLSIEWLKNK
jgi:hypothetical protein